MEYKEKMLKDSANCPIALSTSSEFILPTQNEVCIWTVHNLCIANTGLDPE